MAALLTCSWWKIASLFLNAVAEASSFAVQDLLKYDCRGEAGLVLRSCLPDRKSPVWNGSGPWIFEWSLRRIPVFRSSWQKRGAAIIGL